MVCNLFDNVFMVKSQSNKDILADNLKRLMDKNKHTQGDVHRLTGLSQSSIGRILNKQVDATISSLDVLAHLYKLQSWQLLVLDMQPSNPPVLKEVSEKEREFYERIKLAAQELAKYE
jgi:transcriptional regulator with XRE-family HTH domain